jgi:hypothetical protein
MDFRPFSAARRSVAPAADEEPAGPGGFAWLHRSEAFAEDLLEAVAPLPQCRDRPPQGRQVGDRDGVAGGTRAGSGALGDALGGVVGDGRRRLGWQGA